MSYSNINHVVLVGRLTKDPELRALPSGVSVCGLRVACSTSRRDAEGDYQEKPNFFDVSVFGGAAESVSRYMRKGSRLGIAGRLEWREWETTDQQKRQAVNIVADTVQFLDSPSGARRENEPSGESGGGDELDGGEEREGQEDHELVGVGAGGEEQDLVF
jgi:single-strand DNA-binding protein